MVLANGDIVQASSNEKLDLFSGAASSFGTLGVTTLFKIQLIEAKSFVELTYFPVTSMSEAQDKVEEATKDVFIDYIDGIMFYRERGVICVGRLTNEVDQHLNIQGFTRPTDPWFYIHVDKLINKRRDPVTDAMPLVDYLFRYDRGGFWVGRFAFDYFITPFNRITRFILDYFMHTRILYHALHQSGLSAQYIVQDVAIPSPKATEFMRYLDTSFRSYPIWLCPLKQSGKSTASTHRLHVEKMKLKTPEMMLNFGVWGSGPKDRDEFVLWNRMFERKVHELGGQKWLYAHAYYTEKEFNEIYNREEYDALRKKYFATYLPSVYDKVKVDIEKEKRAIRGSWIFWMIAVFWSIWPLAGLYCMYKVLLGGDYLLPKPSKKEQEL
jgi:delta24-sterol reductase